MITPTRSISGSVLPRRGRAGLLGLGLILGAALPACNGDDGEGSATTATTSDGLATTAMSTMTTMTASGGESEASTTDMSAGSESMSATDATTTDATSDATTTDATTDATTTDATTTDATTDATTTTGETTAVGDTETTGDECIPVFETEMICDGIDDDCNGIIDDVDLDNDGFCDCLTIALFGNPGSNPNAQFEAWLESKGTTVARIGTQGETVTPELIAPYDVIILDLMPRAYSPEEAAHFQAWVEAGGGLMAMTGHTANETVAITWPNSILSPLGAGYIGGLLSQPVTDFTPHPLTEGLSSVTFLGGFRVEATLPGDHTMIASLPQGPVAIAREVGDGRLYLWGDEWVQFDSEWQNIPEIGVFWQNALAWLTPDNFCTIPQ